LKHAVRLQAKANRIIAELLNYDFIAFEREILRLQGVDVGLPRKPVQQLTEEQKMSILSFARQVDDLNLEGSCRV
jgi:N-acetylneuraminate lyase